MSGGDQQELRQVFAQRTLSHYFRAIYGSPETKSSHCSKISAAFPVDSHFLFVGDSRLDHEAAAESGFDFAFISRYTDFDDWHPYCEQHGLPHHQDFNDLMDADVVTFLND